MPDVPIKEVLSVGIIGGGTMGSGIAMNFANAGIPVKVLEINNDAIEHGKSIIKNNYSISISKGKLTKEQVEHCLSLISGTTNYSDLANVDLVIEAVFEEFKIKKQVFTQLDTHCKKSAILATNTSYLDIDEIAEVTNRPQNVIGMHFFSPANIMKLLEIIKGTKTAANTIKTVMALAGKINKHPVLAKNCFGFIGNRIFRVYTREAQLCLLEGCYPEQVDSVLKKFGMAMGPFAVGDLIGLDVSYKIRQSFTQNQKDETAIYCIADTLVKMGRYGQKTGSGYYQYKAGSRVPLNDPKVLTLIINKSTTLGIQRRNLSDDEIQNRLIFAMINEGANILDEGVAQSANNIDAVLTLGYGFPSSLGGPMQYAETIGLKKVFNTICEYQDRFGKKYWTPSSLLEKSAKEGSTFSHLSTPPIE